MIKFFYFVNGGAVASLVNFYEDFFSDFHRKVFEQICLLESDGGYDFALLGQYFSPEEIGRLEGLVQKRRSLTRSSFFIKISIQCRGYVIFFQY